MFSLKSRLILNNLKWHVPYGAGEKPEITSNAYVLNNKQKAVFKVECSGCNLANKKEPVNVVWEDDHVCCFLDHAPFNEGHILILPKKHVRYFDELDESTATSIMKAAGLLSKVIKELFNPDGITVCQNGGSFDELTHFHMHVVPRYEGQNFASFYSEETEEVAVDEVGLSKTRRIIINAINSI